MSVANDVNIDDIITKFWTMLKQNSMFQEAKKEPEFSLYMRNYEDQILMTTMMMMMSLTTVVSSMDLLLLLQLYQRLQ